MKRWLRRVFAHDIGRKLLALLFALVLFDVLDKKIQATDRLTVTVVYVDESELDRVPESSDRGSKLVVAERGRGPKPLVVSSRPPPDRLTFDLRATKEAIERARSRRYTFVLRLTKEGVVEPTVADLEGVERLRDELGPGAQITIEPIQWLVEPEETTDPFVLERDDLVLRGSPAPGFDRRLHTATFQPTRVRLVGPRSSVDKAMRSRSYLFEALELDGRASEVTQTIPLHRDWGEELRLQDENGQELAAVRVTVKFDRHIVPVPGADGTFELPVHVVCNDEVLHARDPQKSDGWRLDLTKARDGVLKLGLQILAPESFVAAPVVDRAKLALARDKVELLVRAQDAAGIADRTTLPVSIQKLEDFPPDLDVVFADGSRRAEVEVVWVRPAAPGEGVQDPKETPKDGKSGGNGGE